MNLLYSTLRLGKGGRLLVSGSAGNSAGYFIRPIIFTDVDSKTTIAQEEIFGSVLVFIKMHNYNEAIEIVNKIESSRD